ncbi:MAG: DUF3422 domain-containing protein [Rhodobacteraceae bacterium CG17_big_fil_post_rev_8_21_14_2_50_65_11]|nr:MAG: DUF3422 domain-containing protein [Rhodobacteraceae bacterium CG17_big_fil_post_rev_8_21_14_2_50_65_11]
MQEFSDHPLRHDLAHELHARPFPAIAYGSQAALLALKTPSNAAARDRDADRAHLITLLDRHGAQHPRPDATHFSGQIGRYQLKWEQHTEFVTYMVHGPGLSDRPFDPAIWDVFPEDWLAQTTGLRVTSAHFRISDAVADDTEIPPALRNWFEPESLAVSRVLDDNAVLASDFRIDPAGHMRFAIFPRPATDQSRIGRIVQRLAEIETYKTMAMLGFPRARDLNARMAEIDSGLSALLADMSGKQSAPEVQLDRLLGYATDLENLMSRASFRFGATGAYEAIVQQRIEVLREERFEGRQTFAEFMLRRFDPAMRTVKSTERRLQSMTDRAFRAGELLRTKVEVDRSAQNQALLESMDRRAALQLRLQETVEGLSVVAISYYAVNLLAYLLAPVGAAVGVEKPWIAAALVLPVVIGVALTTRRIRKTVH